MSFHRCRFFSLLSGVFFSGLLSIVSVEGLCQTSNHWAPAKWSDLPGWRDDRLDGVVEAFTLSCQSLKRESVWRRVCSQAKGYGNNTVGLKRFIERRLRPYRVIDDAGQSEALVTGYYEPLLSGSRYPTEQYRYALYRRPDDLLVADPPLQFDGMDRPVSRVKRNGDDQAAPYDTRGDLMQADRLKGYELLWVADPVELFFLQIQGSGRIRLDDGEIIRVGFADHNGHPYRSIGRVLIERGELAPNQASMRGIQRWARTHPDQLDELLAQNPRFIFFKEQTDQSASGPIGSLGVPLTAGRSIAVDRRYIPLGVPVFLSTTMPNSTDPLNRLVFAQDTGNAIVGPTRADFFWGYGHSAEAYAGKMKQKGRLWVLQPR